MSTTQVRRGRPDKFSPKEVRTLKSVCRKHGLRRGQGILLADHGIEVSLPTLAKYISTKLGGTNPVQLRRGRPKLAA
jgi:hypothetical protein